MRHETFLISAEGFDAELTTYLLDSSDQIDASRLRPMVLICPGGGYHFTSDREAEPIAIQFLAQGYHACVLRYSCAPARFPVALMQVAQAIAMIRSHAEAWHVAPDKVVVMGFSAGGHLAASMGAFWHTDYLAERTGLLPQQVRPDGVILCYPVITSGGKGHMGSFDNLLGEKAGDEAMRAFVSIEKRVTPQMPPVFLWHTYPDGAVPVENALVLMDALRRADVVFEAHVYPVGGHGLGLGTLETASTEYMEAHLMPSVAGWIGLAGRWIAMLDELR